jgi:Flp pilus assembly protein TadD
MNHVRAMTDDERRLLERALNAHQRGEFDAALIDYSALLETFPRHAAILSNRASIHLARDDAAPAEHDARIATASDPSSFGAWFNLGLALRRMGDVANASSAFRRASALRSADSRALLEWFSAAACSQQFDVAASAGFASSIGTFAARFVDGGVRCVVQSAPRTARRF